MMFPAYCMTATVNFAIGQWNLSGNKEGNRNSGLYRYIQPMPENGLPGTDTLRIIMTPYYWWMKSTYIQSQMPYLKL